MHNLLVGYIESAWQLFCTSLYAFLWILFCFANTHTFTTLPYACVTHGTTWIMSLAQKSKPKLRRTDQFRIRRNAMQYMHFEYIISYKPRYSVSAVYLSRVGFLVKRKFAFWERKTCRIVFFLVGSIQYFSFVCIIDGRRIGRAQRVIECNDIQVCGAWNRVWIFDAITC